MMVVKLDLQSIAYEAKTLNLAKEGFTTYYVDGTLGLDVHDGGSWAQAFKTIQYAIDESESWAKIYIKAGTYAENVTINKQGIQLIGEKKETVIISPTEGDALTGTANGCIIKGITAKANKILRFCITISGNDNKVTDCIVDAGVAGTIGCGMYGNHNEIFRVYPTTNVSIGISLAGDYALVHECIVDGAGTSGIDVSGDYGKIYDNTILNTGSDGIWISSGDYNTIYHNNLVNNGTQVKDAGTGNKWFENYYDDHVTDLNNSGIADTPYTFTGGADYQPISRRNGCKQESLPTIGIDDALFRKVSKSITLSTAVPAVAEALFTITGEVECYVIGYIDTAVTSGGALTLEVGISGDTAGLIALTTVGNLAIDKLWVDATPATMVSQPAKKIIGKDADIAHIIKDAAATGGAITYYCWWRPLSSDGNVVAV